MFRSKRTNLVRRLLKCRVVNQNEATCTTESAEEFELKSAANSLLKRLKENHLETLIQAVESKGGGTTTCVLLPKADRLGKRTVAPNILCCQLWRWPNIDQEFTLKQLPCCTNQDSTLVCCNPFHWSCVLTPPTEDPPPPYHCTVIEQLEKPDDNVDSESIAVSTETGGTPTAYRLTPPGSGSSSTSRGPFWCNIAYWEHRQRVGRLFTVFNKSVNVFQQLPHGDGMCLGVLQMETRVESVKRTRDKIGFGLTLSQEDDGVWVYNRSEHPIFVNSPCLDQPNSRTFVVIKVAPGYSLKIFDYEKSEVLKRTRDPQFLDGPYDPNAIRISFAKGWGSKGWGQGSYSRQFITSCPCWIEILLSINR